MRTISADVAAILASAKKQCAFRLQVKDAGGTYRDMTTYPGVDFVEELTWGEDNDSPGVTWSGTLTRNVQRISASPLMQASPLNRGFNPAASYAPLLKIGRQMKVEYSLQAAGDPRARSWVHAFSGFITNVDGGGGKVKLTGEGLERRIRNTYIRRERWYAYAQGAAATKGCFIWPDPDKGETYTTFAVGDLGLPTAAKTNGHFYKVDSITTGIVGATEPDWPTGGGATVVDGGVTWKEAGAVSISAGTPVETVMQQILDDNLGAGVVTLWCPVSPSWQLVGFQVNGQPTWDELDRLADQIGWCLRYIDDAGTPKLKLFDPLRTTTTSLRTFAPEEVDEVQRLSFNWDEIRNTIRGIYSDAQDRDAGGNARRKAVEVTDAGSVADLGDLFAAIAEASTGNIDSEPEITALIVRVLSDVSSPEADMQVLLMFLFPFVEVCDLYTLGADGLNFDADQKLAVTSYSHSYSDNEQSTTLRLRGKPASKGVKGWMERFDDADGAEQHALSVLETTTPIQLFADTLPVGGTRISFDWNSVKAPHDTLFELHLSRSSGFTPDASTLVASGKEQSFEVGNLDPSFEHYAKLVPVTWNGRKPVRGGASAEVAFTPGRALATHLTPECDWGNLPLNGGFETQIDPTMPPDFWNIGFPLSPGNDGVWNADIFLVSNDAGGLSGKSYIRLVAGTEFPAMNSANFTINELETYKLTMWRKVAVSGGASVAFYGVLWFDKDNSYISNTAYSFLMNSSVGSWVKETQTAISPPSGARFARTYFGTVAGELHIDCQRLVEL